jgi:hypothetical protein
VPGRGATLSTLGLWAETHHALPDKISSAACPSVRPSVSVHERVKRHTSSTELSFTGFRMRVCICGCGGRAAGEVNRHTVPKNKWDCLYLHSVCIYLWCAPARPCLCVFVWLQLYWQARIQLHNQHKTRTFSQITLLSVAGQCSLCFVTLL